MVENIEKAVTEQLKAILVNDFQRWYEEWEQRLWRCVASQGNYFEGDKSICSLKINQSYIESVSLHYLQTSYYYVFSSVLSLNNNPAYQVANMALTNYTAKVKCLNEAG